jgi:hypothetical protein
MRRALRDAHRSSEDAHRASKDTHRAASDAHRPSRTLIGYQQHAQLATKRNAR